MNTYCIYLPIYHKLARQKKTIKNTKVNGGESVYEEMTNEGGRKGNTY